MMNEAIPSFNLFRLRNEGEKYEKNLILKNHFLALIMEREKRGYKKSYVYTVHINCTLYRIRKKSDSVNQRLFKLSR